MSINILKKFFQRYWISLIIPSIILNVFLSAYWLILGDIHYDVDVSRDFLVIDDIVRNHHLTLLGPRSGAIPGIFHGPLWFYVNLPAFIIGGGNPLVIGWFWFILSIVFILLVFWVAKKLFGSEVALLSALLVSVNSIVNPSIGLKNFYNPYGAVFLTPLFFWWFYQYVNSLKVKYLILTLFILGLIIQFQMAFGVPILLIITIFLSYFLFKKKKIHHFLSYFILLLPLSSFIIFDLKHDSLQLKSLIQYFNQKENFTYDFLKIILDRLNAYAFDFFTFLSPGKNLLTFSSSILFLITFIYSFRKSSANKKKIYWLFAYFFLGFWLISLFYRGGVGNYFWPFLPVTIIILCSFYKFLSKEIFAIAFIILYLVNLHTGISAILDFQTDINKRGPHSWAFNLEVAKKIYQDANQDFGYYTFSPDRFAYQQRYAFAYAEKYFPSINSYSSTKKQLTYLIEVDPPKDRPDLNSINWRISDIKIDRPPDYTFHFDFIQVKKYLLNEQDLKVQTNPYLQDLLFLR